MYSAIFLNEYMTYTKVYRSHYFLAYNDWQFGLTTYSAAVSAHNDMIDVCAGAQDRVECQSVKCCQFAERWAKQAMSRQVFACWVVDG